MAVAVLALVFGAAAYAGVGKLSQKSGTEGCISEDGTGGDCADKTKLSVTLKAK